MTAAYSILLIEDDTHLGFLLKERFEQSGYHLVVATSGSEGLVRINEMNFDLYLLDLMLPDENGLEIAKKIRQLDPGKPFMFLTAVKTDPEKFKGYELGAEDYITKPFSFKELEFKVRVVLRRLGKKVKVATLSFGDLILQEELRVLRIGSHEFKLTKRECELLYEFIIRQNEVVNRKEILIKLWGREDIYTTRSMDVYLAKIRKILAYSNSVQLESVYGEGHRLVAGLLRL